MTVAKFCPECGTPTQGAKFCPACGTETAIGEAAGQADAAAPEDAAYDTTGAQPNESPKERVDRELSELLEEIRVLLPGVEILFGFLIILPFSGGLREVSGFERVLYLASLLTTSAGLALLVSPTTYHRLRFREMDKERMLFTVNRLVIVASVLVLLGIGLAVYLVVESILGGALAGLIAAGNALWFAWFWFGLPLLRKSREPTTD